MPTKKKPTAKPRDAAPEKQPCQIFLVAPDPIFRERLVKNLSREPDFTVCGQAADADQARVGISKLRPDLAVVDISRVGEAGLKLLLELRTLNRRGKLLVVGTDHAETYADQVFKAGGDGYILEQEVRDDVADAIRDVLGGRVYLSDRVMASKGAAARKSSPPNLKISDRGSQGKPKIAVRKRRTRGCPAPKF